MCGRRPARPAGRPAPINVAGPRLARILQLYRVRMRGELWSELFRISAGARGGPQLSKACCYGTPPRLQQVCLSGRSRAENAVHHAALAPARPRCAILYLFVGEDAPTILKFAHAMPDIHSQSPDHLAPSSPSAPFEKEGADGSGGRCMMRTLTGQEGQEILYCEEGADRSVWLCIVRRAPTSQKGAERENVADRSGGRCMVRRAPTDLEGAAR